MGNKNRRKTNKGTRKDIGLKGQQRQRKTTVRKNSKEEKCYFENEFQSLLKFARDNGRNFICVGSCLEFLYPIRNVKCAMCIIKRLRNKGVNIHFRDEQLKTIDLDNDMEIGANLELAGIVLRDNIEVKK